MGVPRPTRGTAAGRRQPDIVCTDPESNITYVFDVRTAWKISSTSSGAYKTGDLANEGEAEKIAHWAYVTQYHEAFRNDNAVFVPFGLAINILECTPFGSTIPSFIVTGGADSSGSEDASENLSDASDSAYRAFSPSLSRSLLLYSSIFIL